MTNQRRTKSYLRQRKEQCEGPGCRHKGRDVRYRVNHAKILCNNCAISRQPGDVKRRIILPNVGDVLNAIAGKMLPQSGTRRGITMPLPPDFNPITPKNH